MLIIEQDNLQAFISKSLYNRLDEELCFTLSFVIQINGKIRTTYANLHTVSAEYYNKKHEKNDNVGVCTDSKYVIDDEREVSDLISTLNNLGYSCGNTQLMRQKVSKYINNFY